MGIQKQIENFYRDLYGYKSCKDSIEDIEKFLGEAGDPQVTEAENSNLKEEIQLNTFIKSCKLGIQ